MNIQAVGTDIEEVGRFRKMPIKKHRQFYRKVFTDAEIRYCLSKDDPYPHFAARFAAKEAVLKCLKSSVYRVKDVEIKNDQDGVPHVIYRKQRGNFLVSLSHTKNYALAFAIWLN